MERLYHTLLDFMVAECREFECRNYETCLDKAAKERWKSFSCKDCEDKDLPLIVVVGGQRVIRFDKADS